MAVQDLCPMFGCHPGDGLTETRLEPLGPFKSADRNPEVSQLPGPRARRVEAANRHRDLTVQPSGKIDDQTLRSSR